MLEKYIHYGSNHFDPERFVKIRNSRYTSNKPIGGLWASPEFIENKHGYCCWKDWCTYEHYATDRLETSFEFTLTDDARILYLNDVITIENGEIILHDDSLRNCIDTVRKTWMESTHPMATEMWINFELLVCHGYDAIQVLMDHAIYWKLYGWDVDSILIFNPDCIVEVK